MVAYPVVLVRARTAERYGLIHEVTANTDELGARATAIAELMANHSGTALGLAKSLCQAAAEVDATTSFRFEGVAQQALLAQPDLATRFQAALAFIKAQFANPG